MLNVAEDAYPQPGDKAVVENQLINIFIDGLYFDYLKMKVLRDDPGTFQTAIQSDTREQNIRKRFTLRQYDGPRDNKDQGLILTLGLVGKRQWRFTITDTSAVASVKD